MTDSTMQKLAPLVQWWLGDKEVQLTYTPNRSHRGQVSPEYDAVYWLSGRRITEKALGFLMMNDFFTLNHRFSIVQVRSALLRYSWNHYVETHEYTDADRGPPIPAHVGRPKLLPYVFTEEDKRQITEIAAKRKKKRIERLSDEQIAEITKSVGDS